MGQKKSRHSSAPKLHEAVIRRIISITSFLPDEIQYFYYDFLKYTPKGHLTLPDFEKFYQNLFQSGQPEKFAEYVFNAYDTNHDGVVDFEEFIIGLYYSTKATPNEKIRWAFDFCDRDGDHQLDVYELENVIQALYELSDVDMARAETYDEAMRRIKQLLLANPNEDKENEFLDSITKGEFVDIVQSDQAIIKLIDCPASINKRQNKLEASTNFIKKHLKFSPLKTKSLSDSTLTAIK